MRRQIAFHLIRELIEATRNVQFLDGMVGAENTVERLRLEEHAKTKMLKAGQALYSTMTGSLLTSTQSLELILDKKQHEKIAEKV